MLLQHELKRVTRDGLQTTRHQNAQRNLMFRSHFLSPTSHVISTTAKRLKAPKMSVRIRLVPELRAQYLDIVGALSARFVARDRRLTVYGLLIQCQVPRANKAWSEDNRTSLARSPMKCFHI